MQKPQKSFTTDIKPTSYNDIIALQPVLKTIAALKREGNTLDAEIKISVLIREIFTFYHETISDANIVNLVDTVKQVGYMLNGADFELFKTHCLAGKYELKFRLTPPVFIDWLRQYIDDRGESFANRNMISHKQAEKEPISDKTLSVLSEVFKPKPVEEYPEVIQRHDPVRALTQKLIAEFHANAKTEMVMKVLSGNDWVLTTKEVPAYVEYNGKNLHINEYISARFTDIYNEKAAEYAESARELSFQQWFETNY